MTMSHSPVRSRLLAAGLGAALAVGALVGAGSAQAAPFGQAAAATGWTYTIPVGAHSATLSGSGSSTKPLAGLTSRSWRTYQLALNTSAKYVLAHPTDPSDQLDWNKLPGVSDCNTVDLSQYGVMFGWRWNTTSNLLEVVGYWNVKGVHMQTPVLFTLSEAELAMKAPLTYSFSTSGNTYKFAVSGKVGTRTINASGTGNRGCTNTPLLRWAAGFYFGGTSVAEQVITSTISETN